MAAPEPAADGITAIIAKILTQHDPWWWLGALIIVVAIPSFFWKLPETIKAVSDYHDQYRKTSHKIRTERAKLENAIAARKSGSTKGRKP